METPGRQQRMKLQRMNAQKRIDYNEIRSAPQSPARRSFTSEEELCRVCKFYVLIHHCFRHGFPIMFSNCNGVSLDFWNYFLHLGILTQTTSIWTLHYTQSFHSIHKHPDKYNFLLKNMCKDDNIWCLLPRHISNKHAISFIVLVHKDIVTSIQKTTLIIIIFSQRTCICCLSCCN